MYSSQEVVTGSLERVMWGLFENEDHISRRNSGLFVTCAGKDDPLLVRHASLDE